MNQHEIITELASIGWTKQEAKLYVVLLQLGPQPASSVAKHLHLNRLTTYHALERLVEKKYISRVQRKGVAKYQAVDPSQLLSMIQKEKKLTLDRLEYDEKVLQFLSPHLESMAGSDFVLPTMQIFYGKEALKDIYTLSLKTKKMCTYFNPTSFKHDKKLQDIDEWHTKERVQRDIALRAITLDTKDGRAFANADNTLRTTKFISLDQFPIKDVTLITDKGVYIFSKGEEVGIALESSYMAQNQQVVFDLAWANLK